MIVYRQRPLKYWKWAIEGEKGKIPDFVIYDKKRETRTPINVVYAMSLVKYLPTYFNVIRIIKDKAWRAKIRGFKERFKKMRIHQREKRVQQKIAAKARKVKK